MRRQWTCKRWWGRWVCEQWRQILMQQSKQNMFLSFLLAHSWTAQGLKNFSARRIWSQRGIIDDDELIPTWSTYQKKQQTQLLINEIKENSKKAVCVYIFTMLNCWWLIDIGGSWVSVRDSKESSTDIHTTSKMWPVSCDCENERVLSVSAPTSKQLLFYLSIFFFLSCSIMPMGLHHLTPFSRALALV